MSNKYIIEFTKTGTICYTSHLDLMRIFKRAFKRSEIALSYSQGFNPHPKMGFAQPLSLGYWGMEEYIEFETELPWEKDQLLQRLAVMLPEGIDLKQCLTADKLTKTLAAHSDAARYVIAVPLEANEAKEGAGSGADVRLGTAEGSGAAQESPQPGQSDVPPDPDVDLTDPRSLWHSYMDQEEIGVWKRQKKKKEPKLIDIKPMIREITFQPEDDVLYIDTTIDCGSGSNLSPELIIGSVLRRFGIGTDRSEISVMRKQLYFDKPLEELL